ncbi:zinc-finger domain-containing protein [Bacillus tianshenii]|nr:zinc-finger domain-containing protein [Bacillus tianshenii]
MIEPAVIRRKVIRLLDNVCRDCKILNQNRNLYGQHEAHRYCIGTCQVGVKISKLGQQIGSDVLPPYTLDEEFYLLGHMELIGDGKLYSYRHIARKLARTEISIIEKLEQLKELQNEKVG